MRKNELVKAFSGRSFACKVQVCSALGFAQPFLLLSLTSSQFVFTLSEFVPDSYQTNMVTLRFNCGRKG